MLKMKQKIKPNSVSLAIFFQGSLLAKPRSSLNVEGFKFFKYMKCDIVRNFVHLNIHRHTCIMNLIKVI